MSKKPLLCKKESSYDGKISSRSSIIPRKIRFKQPLKSTSHFSDRKKNKLKKDNEEPKDKIELKFIPEPIIDWCYSNTISGCFDCNNLIVNSKKGHGFALTGEAIYFCAKCYTSRFNRGERTPINLRDKIIAIDTDEEKKGTIMYLIHRRKIYQQKIYTSYEARQKMGERLYLQSSS